MYTPLFALICLLWSPALDSNHDIQVAFFKIKSEKERLTCDVIIEEKDLVEVLMLKDQSKKQAQKKILDYLSENFKLKVNGKTKSINYQFAESKSKHIHLRGRISKSRKKVKSLNVTNNCFKNIEDHSNILEVRLNEQERDFLMNASRTEININF